MPTSSSALHSKSLHVASSSCVNKIQNNGTGYAYVKQNDPNAYAKAASATHTKVKNPRLNLNLSKLSGADERPRNKSAIPERHSL
jgi:hypothetical protein